MADDVRVQDGGNGQPVLLLLHGLGATGDVWNRSRPLLVRHWPGRWLAPDLPGHGGSQPLAGYSFESLAANVAPRAPVVLARGEHDPMVTGEQLAQLDAPTVTLPGLGHNAHVEDPETVIRLLCAYR